MKLILNTDGGSRGNPGPAAYGYAVRDVSQVDAGIVLEKCGNYLGITTNNQAEYAALIAGLSWIIDHFPASEVVIRMDSLLIVNQVKGLYKVKSPDLLPKFKEVKGLLSKLPKWSIEHTYREGNSLADSLVNEALDAHQS
jgi:probable phosphoglycerate mutase